MVGLVLRGDLVTGRTSLKLNTFLNYELLVFRSKLGSELNIAVADFYRYFRRLLTY